MLAFEVVKSGDSAFFGFGAGEIKKRGGTELAVGEQAGKSSRAE